MRVSAQGLSRACCKLSPENLVVSTCCPWSPRIRALRLTETTDKRVPLKLKNANKIYIENTNYCIARKYEFQKECFSHVRKPRATFFQIVSNDKLAFITDEGLKVLPEASSGQWKRQWQTVKWHMFCHNCKAQYVKIISTILCVYNVRWSCWCMNGLANSKRKWY